MIVTEEEAKEKDCPVTPANSESFFSCIASKCMAWRKCRRATTAAPGTGYCGLAGKPD